MAVDYPPDDFTLHVIQWLRGEIYPGLLQEPFDDRAMAVWVAGSRGFLGLWISGHSAGIDPTVRLENIKHELFRRIYETKFPSQPAPGPVGNRVPQGRVRLLGRNLRDDRGTYLGLGASFFWAPRAFRDYRDRYEANMAWLAQHGFNYYRAFVTTGGWPGDDPWRDAGAFPPWALEVLPRMLEDALIRFNLRCSLTLFDGQNHFPTDAEQNNYVREVCRILRPRLETIQDVQIANEYGPTGWDNDIGISRLRRHVRTVRDELGTDLLLSVSSMNATMQDSPYDEAVHEARRLLDLSMVNVSVNHDSRDMTKIDGPWRHVRQGWERLLHGPNGEHLWPEASIDDEPSGPRASVAAEEDPQRIVGKALVSWIAGRCAYTFHPDAGIWSDLLHPRYKDGFKGAHKHLFDHAPSEHVGRAFAKLIRVLPTDLPNWTRTRHGFENHPFAASFQKQGDIFTQIWPDQITPYGVVRAYTGLNGNDFVTALTGIRDRFHMQWTRSMNATIYHCGTGDPIGTITPTERARVLNQSIGTDLVIIGSFT